MKILSKKLVLGCSAGVAALALASAACAQVHDFNVPSEEAVKSIPEFARQAGIQIIAPATQLHGVVTPAINGSLDTRAALKTLLQGTGLEVAADTGSQITLRHAAATPAPTAGASAPETQPSTVSEVTVTGTNIRGGTVASPLLTVSRSDIENGGFTSADEVLKALPENYNGGAANVFGSPVRSNVFANGIGTATPSLRGLGDATLTLLDGRRMSHVAGFNGTDISSIPLAAVDHVEVLLDGASSVYGADAIAGVINFVLKKNYEGLEASLSEADPTRGGGDRQVYSAVGGKDWSSGNVILSYDRTDQDALYASQRSFSSSVVGENTIVAPETQDQGSLFLRQNLTPDLLFHVDGIANSRVAQSFFAFPTAATERGNDYRARQYAANLGLTYTLGSWSLDLTGGADDDREVNRNFLVSTQAVVSTADLEDKSDYLEFNANGPVIETPGGPVKLAVGGGGREESFASRGTSKLSGDRRIEYLYGELDWPIVGPANAVTGVQRLDLSLSGRIDHYSDFGEASNPKVGVLYQPVDAFRLRGTWGTSFRPPTLTELYTPGLGYLFLATDSRMPPGPFVALFNSGGNEHLRPEKSNAWTLSADITPPSIKNFTLTVTGFSYDFANRIVTPQASVNFFSVPLSDPALEPYTTLSPSASAVDAYVAHDATLFNLAGSATPADVKEILNYAYSNAAKYQAQGVDINAAYSTGFAGGELGVSLNATFEDIRQQLFTGGPYLTVSGIVFNPPHSRARAGVSWTDQHWTLAGTLNYVGPFRDAQVGPSHPIGSFTTFDVHAAYAFANDAPYILRGARVGLTAANLFDTNPPRLAPTLTGSVPGYAGMGYDSANASPFGRVITLQLVKAW